MFDSSFTPPRGRLINLSDAVGTILAHDITEIRPIEFKGPAFKKGHMVAEADIQHLARLGKQHLYVLEIGPDMLHEDEAVLVLAQSLAGPGATYNPNPSEGKINLVAAHDGLLKVDTTALTEFNLVEGVMCASRHANTVVKKGEILAGTRAIPLVIEKNRVEEAADRARRVGGVFSVKPLARPKAGLVITGGEVYTGLIKDRSAPIVSGKLKAFGCEVLEPSFAPDDADFIARAIVDKIAAGAELIVATGGMSVDPDDVTKLGIAKAGARDIVYGSSVLPGAMLLLARIGSVPVVGVPACAIFHPRTIFDVVLPRILAGELLGRRELAALAHGGLCLNCPSCHFPACPFGKAC
ncbi:MAG: molybdopterin-binding protein [Pseudomonadota bacterium]